MLLFGLKQYQKNLGCINSSSGKLWEILKKTVEYVFLSNDRRMVERYLTKDRDPLVHSKNNICHIIGIVGLVKRCPPSV